jgi:hypothetical protein
MANIDIRSGEYDDYFKTLNTYSDSISEYTPYNPHLLTREKYMVISQTLAQFPYILSQWQGNVGQNGTSVIVTSNESNAESTKTKKQRLEKQLYDFLFVRLKWANIQVQIIELVAREGNAVVMLNSEGELIIHSLFRFNVYFESNNRTKRYAFKDKKGSEIAGMANLKHGEEIYHIQDPVTSSYAVSPSRLDNAFSFILLEQKGVKANTALFANGFLMNVFLKLNPDILPKIKDDTKDKNGKTWWQRFMDGLNDRFAGTNKAGRVGYIPGLDGIIEAGKTSKDSQFYDLIRELTPERIAWAYSMTLADFGAGKSATYNNATTFDDALYDKVGRPLESILDDCRNNFILKKLFNIPISSSLYVKYNEPEDPNKLEESKNWREDYLSDAITLNEYRDKRGLENDQNGDIYHSQIVNAQAVVEPKKVDDGEQIYAIQFKEDDRTPIEKALRSKQYIDPKKGLFIRLKRGVEMQINAFLKDFEKMDAVQDDYSVVLPAFEEFYAFNVLNGDLLKFAGMGLEEVKKDKRIAFKKEFFDGEYPQVILDMINQRTEALLKGSEVFESIDVATASQIETIIRDNINLGVTGIAELLVEAIPKISQSRAELIAHQEVTNAVEGTREIIYKNAFKKGLKEWQTVGDERVRESHTENEKQGKIDINSQFSSSDSSPASAFRCRCTVIYYPPE